MSLHEDQQKPAQKFLESVVTILNYHKRISRWVALRVLVDMWVFYAQVSTEAIDGVFGGGST